MTINKQRFCTSIKNRKLGLLSFLNILQTQRVPDTGGAIKEYDHLSPSRFGGLLDRGMSRVRSLAPGILNIVPTIDFINM